jgi:hypothetical protein
VPLSAADWEQAKEALARRERTWSAQNRCKSIGSWSVGDAERTDIVGLSSWVKSRGAEHVIWTALPPAFHSDESRIASGEEIVGYLEGLRGPQRQLAETYVRKAPRQIDTAIRRDIEAELGWTPLE